MKVTEKQSGSTSSMTLSDPKYDSVKWVCESDEQEYTGARLCYEACKETIKLIDSVRQQSKTGPFLVNFGNGLYEKLIHAVNAVGTCSPALGVLPAIPSMKRT